MNSKVSTIAKWLGKTILVICLIVIIGNCIFDKVFHNPYRDFESDSSVFNILNQLLSPSITESYLDQEVVDIFPSFSCHSQSIRLLKFSYSHSPYERQNTGKINYRLGRATLENYEDRLGIGDLPCQQSVFLSSNEMQDYWTSISDDQSYEVWIKFEKPIDKTTFSEKYSWLLDNNISRPKQCGILWIPIKTSDKSEDICLGLAGNLSFHHLNPYSVFAEQNFYDIDLFGRELIFIESIEFLIEHPKETNMFIDTGLWKDAESICFKERYEYIQKNGTQYLGFVAYMRGRDLRTLENESISIVLLNNDK